MQDHLSCIRCGYDLRATSLDCPECGYPSELSRKAHARRANSTTRLQLAVALSIFGYVALNIAMYFIPWPFIDRPRFGVFNITIYVLPIIGFIWSLIMLHRAVKRSGEWVLGPWLFGTVLFLALMGVMNYMFMLMATADV